MVELIKLKAGERYKDEKGRFIVIKSVMAPSDKNRHLGLVQYDEISDVLAMYADYTADAFSGWIKEE